MTPSNSVLWVSSWIFPTRQRVGDIPRDAVRASHTSSLNINMTAVCACVCTLPPATWCQKQQRIAECLGELFEDIRFHPTLPTPGSQGGLGGEDLGPCQSGWRFEDCSWQMDQFVSCFTITSSMAHHQGRYLYCVRESKIGFQYIEFQYIESQSTHTSARTCNSHWHSALDSWCRTKTGRPCARGTGGTRGGSQPRMIHKG